MIGTFFLQVMCPTSDYSGAPASYCWSTQHIIFLAFGIALVLLQFGYCYFIAATFYSRMPIDEGLLSRPDSTLARWTVFVKTLMPIIYLLCRSQDPSWSHWALIFVTMLFYFALLVLVAWVRGFCFRLIFYLVTSPRGWNAIVCLC